MSSLVEQMPRNKERGLWRAVIVQALQDLGSNSVGRESKFFKSQAELWLLGDSKDFHTVCDLADLHPERIKRAALKIKAEGMFYRAAAGTGPRYLERKAYREKSRLVPKSPGSSSLDDV